MARGAIRPQKERRSSVRKTSPNWTFTLERVTGIEPALSAWESVPSGPVTCPDLRGGVSASDREKPLVTGVNGPLMARRSWRSPHQSSVPCSSIGRATDGSRLWMMAGQRYAGHDAAVLWRSLREVMPLSAAFLDGGYVEAIYPQYRELRTWPFWEVVERVRAEPAAMP